MKGQNNLTSKLSCSTTNFIVISTLQSDVSVSARCELHNFSKKTIKTFVGGQIIKEILRAVSNVVSHDNKNIISKISLSRFILVRRIQETSNSIKYESLLWFSVAMGESTNKNNTKHFALFHGVEMDFNRTEGLASLWPIKWTTAGADLWG
jgi:hypothetical protein